MRALAYAAVLACSAIGCRSSARPATPTSSATPGQRADTAGRAGAPADGTRDSTTHGGRSGGDSTGRGTSAGSALPDPATAVRFEIVSVGDSTFAFLAPNAPWLTAGSSGIAVDPRRRDILVARFRVLTRQMDTATALVTGQTTRLVTEHVALVSRPPAPPIVLRRIEQRRFWAGAAVGAVFGVIAGLLLQY